MTAVPQPPEHLLTVAEYSELGETEPGYTELVEGRLQLSPCPAPDHNFASGELFVQLRAQVPEHLEVIQDVDINLELAPAHSPGFSRRPDMVVTRAGARRRVRQAGGLLRASEIVLVIEIVSPSSHRTDYITKRGEYADAGIPHYWIIDIGAPVSMLACHLTGEFGYADSGKHASVFATTDPFDFRLNLETLI